MTIITYPYEQLTVVGALHSIEMLKYNNNDNWKTYMPIYAVKENPEILLKPIEHTDTWVRGYQRHVYYDRVGFISKQPTCSFQAKPLSKFNLVYTDKEGFEYVTVEEIDRRKEIEIEKRISHVIDLYDKGVKGKELYKELDYMWGFQFDNTKAITVKAAIAFARMNDSQDAKDYYKQSMERLQYQLRYCR